VTTNNDYIFHALSGEMRIIRLSRILQKICYKVKLRAGFSSFFDVALEKRVINQTMQEVFGRQNGAKLHGSNFGDFPLKTSRKRLTFRVTETTATVFLAKNDQNVGNTAKLLPRSIA